MSFKAACVKAGGLCRESQVTGVVLLLTAHSPKAMTVFWGVLAASTVLVCGSERLRPPEASWERLVLRKEPLETDVLW